MIKLRTFNGHKNHFKSKLNKSEIKYTDENRYFFADGKRKAGKQIEKRIMSRDKKARQMVNE